LLPAANSDRVLDISPDDPTLGCPFKTGSTRFEELGHQFMQASRGIWLNYIRLHIRMFIHSTLSNRSGMGLKKAFMKNIL